MVDILGMVHEGDQQLARFPSHSTGIPAKFRFADDGGALSSQEWRELLNLDLSNPPTGQSHTAQCCRKLYEKLVYNDTTPFSTGVQVQLLAARPPSWEDRCLTTELHPNHARRSKEQLFDRESVIQQCFSPGIFKVVIRPSRNVGLAADSLEERLEYLINVAKVMKS
ncbi:hypothetical protein BJ165DRAFT_1409165 [Panaeolus papilionaceus]|nr:hypothetical protein BJ165DRAFT_1409165 [Panaeolus papilionaceus]